MSNFTSFNNKKSLNLSGFEIEKAAVYKDNYKNRKLGRVGRPYDKSEVRKEDKKDDTKLTKSEKRVDVSKISDKRLLSIARRSEIVKTASNDRVYFFIDNMGLDIDKSKSLRDKKQDLVRSIIDYAELEGSNKEIGESIDEILENDYDFEPKLAHKDKLDKIISGIDIFENIKEKTIDKFIDSYEYKIDKKLSLEDKKREIVDTIIKTSKLEGNNKELSSKLQEILQEGFEEL